MHLHYVIIIIIFMIIYFLFKEYTYCDKIKCITLSPNNWNFALHINKCIFTVFIFVSFMYFTVIMTDFLLFFSYNVYSSLYCNKLVLIVNYLFCSEKHIINHNRF